MHDDDDDDDVNGNDGGVGGTATIAVAGDMTRFFNEYAAKHPESRKAAKRCIEMINASSDGYVATRSLLTKLRQSRGRSGPDSAPTLKQLGTAESLVLMAQALEPDDREKLYEDNPREITRVLESVGSAGAVPEDAASMAQQLLNAIGIVQKRKGGPRLVQYRGAPAFPVNGTMLGGGGGGSDQAAETPQQRTAHALVSRTGLGDIVKRVFETPDDDLTSQQVYEMLMEHFKQPMDEATGEPTFQNAKSAALAIHVLHNTPAPPSPAPSMDVDVVDAVPVAVPVADVAVAVAVADNDDDDDSALDDEVRAMFQADDDDAAVAVVADDVPTIKKIPRAPPRSPDDGLMPLKVAEWKTAA